MLARTTIIEPVADAEPSTQPTPISSDPDFAAENAKLTALRLATADFESELAAVELELAEITMARLEHNDLERAARALISGGAGQVEPLQEKAERLRQAVATHRRAVSLQKARVRAARAEATARAALDMMPAHRRAVEGILAARDALLAAIGEEEVVRQQMGLAGYNEGLMSFAPPIYFMNDHDAAASLWLEHAEKYVRPA